MRNQPLVLDEGGVVRFKENPIVRYLLDNGGIDMNQLALLGFTNEDQAQFAQLIGYSVSGWGDLSYVTASQCKEADIRAEIFCKKAEIKKKTRSPFGLDQTEYIIVKPVT